MQNLIPQLKNLLQSFINEYNTLDKKTRSSLLIQELTKDSHNLIGSELKHVQQIVKKIRKRSNRQQHRINHQQKKSATALHAKKKAELKHIYSEVKSKSPSHEKIIPAALTNDTSDPSNSSRAEEILPTKQDGVTNPRINNKKMKKTPRISKCYICKTPFYEYHFFYPKMCKACGDFNFEKRNQKCDLTGKIALVTGGRVKIGYQIALILLRNNCRVVLTTRFPKDCYLRFEKETDFHEFKDRLEIYPLDLRNFRAVAKFCELLHEKLPHLDILIHNAAQTLRRETPFYQHLLPTEATPALMLGPDAEKCLPTDFKYEEPAIKYEIQSSSTLPFLNQSSIADVGSQSLSFEQISTAALDSQTLLIPENPFERQLKFPQNALDLNNQQIDLSQTNSWVMKADKVPFVEFIETQVINAWAPYWITVGLKPLLLKSPSPSKYVVNVSSMEGKFDYKSKKSFHPHTNMSKAALNMFTRTSGGDFAQDNIFMTSVDTGWVSYMLPCQLGDQAFEQQYLNVPLDEIDGAMRVLDPVFQGYNNQVYMHSVFLKDYKVVTW